jgi:uncharacterized protein (DUF4415 family)
MKKKKRIKRYSIKQIEAIVKRGGSKTDWARAAATTQEQIAASIAADPDEADMVIDWSRGTVEMPQPKAVLNMRVDRNVLDYFKAKGRGYQTKINAVLRNYVEHHSGDRI